MNIENIKDRKDYEEFLKENKMYDDDFIDKYDEYTWCLHCNKTFKKADECPYCGTGFGDVWGWTGVRLPSEFRDSEYPKIPEIGKVYPLYNR